jgi:hypothetical protein
VVLRRWARQRILQDHHETAAPLADLTPRI